MAELYQLCYTSPLGQIILVSDATRLLGAWFEGQRYFMRHLPSTPRVRPNLSVLRQAKAWLDQYFAGQIPTTQLELCPHGTTFQQTIWQLLRQIPYGQTVTYGELARQAAVLQGRPKMSAQAVGGAVGRNPLSLFIPCHRVLGNNGKLVGYAGGLERKRWLLQYEQQYVKLFHCAKKVYA